MNSHNIFCIPNQSFDGNNVTIKGPELRHVVNVLRKRKGEEITVTDGRGYKYQVRIAEIGKSSLVAQILNKQHVPRKSPLEIAVGFVPLKGLRNDSIIEKGTELGVVRFIGFISEHSVIRNVGVQKIKRWKNIAESAMVQSQQYYLPEVIIVRNTEELMLLSSAYESILITEPGGKAAVPIGAKRVMLLVGPEGGFSQSERDFFVEHGASLLSLGPTRLRSETAAIVGISKILAAYGVI